MAKDSNGKAERQLKSVRGLASELADKLDLNASLRLWDGSRIPLGANVTGPFEISIAGPGVIGALLRRPTLDNFIRHYVEKDIDFSGGTLIDLGSQLNRGGRSVKLKGKEALGIAMKLAPFLLTRADKAQIDQGFAGEITGRARKTADNKDYIQFHYDLSNEFYALFLDPEMVYSCAYYTDWQNDIAQAQRDKLEMICRKLRLKPGERFLDIGCGWGGLICHAAKNYGVTAHGITLSEAQLDYAREKIERLGLEDRVTVELKDYSAMEGQFDKIASIGMYEHIGLKNIPGYMRKMQTLLAQDGLFLNHAIARRAPKPGLVPTQDAARAARHRQIHLPRRRARRHRAFARRHGACGLRDPGCRGLAPALRAHVQAVVRAPDGGARDGDRLRRRGKVPHLGGVSGRRVARVLARHVADFPDAGLQVGEAAARAAAHPRRPLPVKPCGGIWVLKTGHLNAGRDSFGRSAFDPKRKFDTVTRSKGRPNSLRPGVEPYIAGRL